MKTKYFNALSIDNIPINDKCFIWANSEVYQQLLDLGYNELECKTCDREAFLIDVDNKNFEIVHKHVVI